MSSEAQSPGIRRRESIIQATGRWQLLRGWEENIPALHSSPHRLENLGIFEIAMTPGLLA